MVPISEIVGTKEPKLLKGITDFICNQARFFTQPESTVVHMVENTSNAELLSHFAILDQSALLSVSDLKGNILHANENFCKISKYKKEELLYKPHSIVRHPDTPSSLFKEMWRTIGKGETWNGEFKNKAKDGSTYWVLATIVPILDKKNKPVKYISVRYDITKQKQTEEELKEAKKKIDTELLENINYAKYIHSTFLGNNEELDDLLEESFLIYKAQKIISGDFYKIEKKDDKIILAVGDSTGHGVSASYISVLALTILSRVMDFWSGDPAKVLRMTNYELYKITQRNKKKQLIESADLISCCIDLEQMKLTYASADMKGFIVRGEQVIMLSNDKCTVGGIQDQEFKINSYEVALEKNDRLYIFSDGLTDQLGGDKNKRIGIKRIVSLIHNTGNKPAKVQKKIIEDALLQWQGENEQTDDITLLSVTI